MRVQDGVKGNARLANAAAAAAVAFPLHPTRREGPMREVISVGASSSVF
jgi:hypothetical protein